jgi:hypothetical protein
MSQNPFVDVTEIAWMAGNAAAQIAINERPGDPGLEPADVRAERILNAKEIPSDSPDYDLFCQVAQIPATTNDAFEAAVVERWKQAFRKLVDTIYLRNAATSDQARMLFQWDINDLSNETFRCEDALYIYRYALSEVGLSLEHGLREMRSKGYDLFATAAETSDYSTLALDA